MHARSHRRSSLDPRTLLFAMALAIAPQLAGCYSTLHGYSVVRSDPDVEYDPGDIALLRVVSGDSDIAAPLEQAMRREFRRRAPEYARLTQPASYSVRVYVEEATEEAGRTNVRARVEIVDTSGTVTSELATAHGATGEDAVEQIGRAFAARIAHYLHQRERVHHW